jgi:hypothetical protein
MKIVGSPEIYQSTRLSLLVLLMVVVKYNNDQNVTRANRVKENVRGIGGARGEEE